MIEVAVDRSDGDERWRKTMMDYNGEQTAWRK